MAKIAVDLQRALAERERNGAPGQTHERMLASGPGWRVADVVCTSGPRDRAFEEQHGDVSIAIVVSGSFQYRAAIRNGGRNCELMSAGALLLGNAGCQFECSHEHGAGDRCVAFKYSPEHFEKLVADFGRSPVEFRTLRMPPLREMSSLVVQACSGLMGEFADWEELGLKLAVQTIRLQNGLLLRSKPQPKAIARVSQVVRTIEQRLHERLSLGDLAGQADLSPYHFLRAFETVTGVTPHQYLLRVRLREAAMRLLDGPEKILDIALDCGFGDVSNFNRNFRAEFGVSPSAWREWI